MTDLEITKLCAEAMGLEVAEQLGMMMFLNTQFEAAIYGPLENDAQAMALVKKFGLEIKRVMETWHVWDEQGDGCVLRKNLNRAIVECVALMQAAKP